jgi:putative phosphoesterase
VKIGVLADSHDHLDYLARAVELLRERKVDLVLHAGDFISPFTIPPLATVGCPVLAVFGNNDGERVGLQARFAQMGAELHERPWSYAYQGVRILLQHEPVALDTFVGSEDFDLVVYGHTHAVDVRIPNQGAILVNPGEVCGWLSGRPTCAIVSLTERTVEILELK